MSERPSWASNMLQPLLPTAIYALSVLIIIIALHFKSHIRPLFLPPSMLLTIGSLLSIRKVPDSGVPEAFLFCQGLTAFYQFLWLPIQLCSANHLFKGISDISGNGTPSLCTSLSFQSVSEAYRQWNNPRQLALQQGASRSRGMTQKDSATVIMFTCRRALKVVALHLINTQIAQPVFYHVMSRAMLIDFAPQSEPLIRRILFTSPDNTLDWDQLAVRALISFHWIWYDYLTLETCHAALATLFVAILDLDDTGEWPALYGNLLDAWSVKRFWGRYWHRIMTPLYSRYASIFSRTVYGAKPGTFTDKLLVAFGIFVISGLGHTFVNWQNNEVALARDLLFFMANFTVVAAEVCISRAAKATLSKSWYGFLVKSWQTSMLGYIWVCFWFLWIVPRWEFPRIYDGWIKAAALE